MNSLEVSWVRLKIGRPPKIAFGRYGDGHEPLLVSHQAGPRSTSMGRALCCLMGSETTRSAKEPIGSKVGVVTQRLACYIDLSMRYFAQIQ